MPNGSGKNLEVDTEIKNVKCVDGGYRFDALIAGAWVSVLTTEDLPAFTDKGRAQRGATLKPGRPQEGSEPMAGLLAVRVSIEQRDYVRAKASIDGIEVSEYLRGLLIADGMPV